MGRAGSRSLIGELLAELLRDGHRYVPGTEQWRPTLTEAGSEERERRLARPRERTRDVLEQAAARAGFTRRHFDPRLAAAALERTLEMAEDLETTHSLLADQRSRRALIDLLKLRVLGPYHARLEITPRDFRAHQARLDREFRLAPATIEVSDPWFTPLSLYRVPVEPGLSITLHGHSVDLASVYLLHQYRYTAGSVRVGVNPGDVVLDVGGCWGDTALRFAAQVGPEGKVYTFEFDPESLEVLRTNLSLNPGLAARVEVVEKALWDRSGTVAFAPAGRMTSVTGDAAEESAPRVSAVTLDEWVTERNLGRVSFVKLDVEGSERRVLAGARDTLTRLTPRLAIAAYHRDDDLIELARAIDSLAVGYRLYLETFSPVEEETVLFASAEAPGRPDAAARRNST